MHAIHNISHDPRATAHPMDQNEWNPPRPIRMHQGHAFFVGQFVGPKQALAGFIAITTVRKQADHGCGQIFCQRDCRLAHHHMIALERVHQLNHRNKPFTIL